MHDGRRGRVARLRRVGGRRGAPAGADRPSGWGGRAAERDAGDVAAARSPDGVRLHRFEWQRRDEPRALVVWALLTSQTCAPSRARNPTLSAIQTAPLSPCCTRALAGCAVAIPLQQLMGRHLVAGTASPRRTPAAVASVGLDLFADGGVTPPYEPPPFEQAIREHQAGGALPAWTDRRLEVSPPRPNPFTSSAASDAVARPTTAADEREWASEHSDDPIAEHSDDCSESPRGHLLD